MSFCKNTEYMRFDSVVRNVMRAFKYDAFLSFTKFDSCFVTNSKKDVLLQCKSTVAQIMLTYQMLYPMHTSGVAVGHQQLCLNNLSI